MTHNSLTEASPLTAAGPLYIPYGPVVPIEYQGKRPASGSGWKGDAALKSAADLMKFRDKPLNVAMRLDKFFVVDVDGDEGRRSLAKLEDRIGPLPRITVQKSGGGGIHIFFRLEDGDEVNRLTKHPDFPKIDFKAGQGHILVMAPSRHSSGNRYELEGSLSDAPAVPQALLELLNKPSAIRSTAGGPSVGREGERHVLLLHQGVRLQNQGWDLRSIREALWQYTTTFRDPWTPDEAAVEIDGIIQWLSQLESEALFPRTATPVDVAVWLRPRLTGLLVYLDNGDWLEKRDNVFGLVRREQLRALFVRTIQPAFKDFERWIRCLDDEDSRARAVSARPDSAGIPFWGRM